jgi:integrase
LISRHLLPPCFPASITKIMPKLTKRFVDALRPDPAGRDLFFWDSELRGFGIRMKRSGSTSFLIQYRTPQAETRRYTFGRVGTLTPEEARTKARRLLADVASGNDPSGQRHDARTAPTVAELCRLYMEAARAGLVHTRFGRAKSKKTVAIDEGRVSRHIIPLLGRHVAKDLTRADVQQMVDGIASGKTAAIIKTKLRGKAVITGGAGTARRVAGLLGGIMTWGSKRGFVGNNPVRGLDLRSDRAEDRVLAPSELAALGRTIRGHEDRLPLACAALCLIALTGMRRAEAYGLLWSEIDFEGSCLRLAATKTGRSTRPIGKAAIDLLRGIPKTNPSFVFPNRGGDKPADLTKGIAEIFDAAGLKDARGHDLRRTFATIAADEGYSDSTIGELLGHARRGVTSRHYIRRPDSALVAAADRVSARIAAALDDVRAVVIEIRKS